MAGHGKVILICGKIGSGKSTYAARLRAQYNAVNISQDELMLGLFGADFYRNAPDLYTKYCARVEEYAKRKAGEAALAGAVVICENGFWSLAERAELRRFYAELGASCELHYIDTPEPQRHENIRRRNEAVLRGESDFFLVKPEDIDHFFEAPDDSEIDVRVPFIPQEQRVV